MLGVTKGRVSHILSGGRNLGADTLADILLVLGRTPHLTMGTDFDEIRFPVDEHSGDRQEDEFVFVYHVSKPEKDHHVRSVIHIQSAQNDSGIGSSWDTDGGAVSFKRFDSTESRFAHRVVRPRQMLRAKG